MTELVDPPTAATATIALRNDSFVMMSLGLRSAATRSTMSRPVSCESESSRASAAGVPAKPGIVMPSASATTAIVDAVPMVLQWPLLRIIDCSDCRNCAVRDRARARLLAEPPDVGAAAERLAAEVAGQHRPAGHDDRREGRRMPRP